MRGSTGTTGGGGTIGKTTKGASVMGAGAAGTVVVGEAAPKRTLPAIAMEPAPASKRATAGGCSGIHGELKMEAKDD